MVDIMSQKYFQIYLACPCASQNGLSGFKKKTIVKFFFFYIFLQSPHEVDMKNMVECQKEFFAYFNALET